MKKIIDLIKKILGLAKTVTPEQKKEAEAIATGVIQALDEVKAKKEAKKEPVAPKGNMIPLEEVPAAPKKKKKYYPAQPKKAK